MTQTRTYPEGVPCWVDLETPDLAASADFYGGLFGWQLEDAVSEEAPGSYVIASLPGGDVAAIAPAPGADEDARWSTYIAVDDATAGAAGVEAAGGRVTFGPEPVGTAGIRVDCLDSVGAAFRLWRPGHRLGAQLVNAPGAWNFSNLRTSAASTALGFYSELFAWEGELYGDAAMLRQPGYGAHLAATADPGIYERQASAPDGFEDAVAGLAHRDSGASEWHVTFAVEDRDAAAAAAERLGATVIGSQDTMWTRTAEIRDPQGAGLTLSQFVPPET